MGTWDIQAFLNGMPSRKVWAVARGVGSFVTIDIGRKHDLQTSDGVHKQISDLHIWIYLCDWKLMSDGEVVLLHDSPAESFSAILAAVIGTELDRIEVGATSEQVVIGFTGGYKFVLQANRDEYEQQDDLLLLYPYGDEAVGYRSDLGFYKDSELQQ